LTPRWYVAVRVGYLSTNGDTADAYEMAAGFRPDTHQIVKLGCEIQHDDKSGQTNRSIMVQLVTTLHPLSLAWDRPRANSK
jgi:hypothetical protein